MRRGMFSNQILAARPVLLVALMAVLGLASMPAMAQYETIYDAGTGSLGDLVHTTGTLTINTDDIKIYSGSNTYTGENHLGVARFQFRNVTVTGGSVSLSGSRPLAILAAGDMTWTLNVTATGDTTGRIGGGLGGTRGGDGLSGIGGTSGGAGGRGGAAGGGGAMTGSAQGQNGKTAGLAGSWNPGVTASSDTTTGPTKGTAGESGHAGESGTAGYYLDAAPGNPGNGGNQGNGGLAPDGSNPGTPGYGAGTAGWYAAGYTISGSVGQGGANWGDHTNGNSGSASSLDNAMSPGQAGGAGNVGKDGAGGAAGGDATFSPSATSLTFAAGFGGGGGGGGGKGSGGDGGGGGGGGHSGGGGGSGAGAWGDHDWGCFAGGDRNVRGGDGGKGGAGGAGTAGTDGAAALNASDGGLGGNGGGAVLLGAAGVLRYAGDYNVSAGSQRTTGGAEKAVQASSDPSDPSAVGDPDNSVRNANRTCGGIYHTNVANWCNGQPEICGGEGGNGNKGSIGGKGGKGGASGKSGKGGDGGYGTPGMVKLQGSVIQRTGTANIIAINNKPGGVSSYQGRFTMITNMTPTNYSAQLPPAANFNPTTIVRGQCSTIPAMLLGTNSPFDALTTHPMIGELTTNIAATRGILKSSYWNKANVDAENTSTNRLGLVTLETGTAGGVFSGYDQIFLINKHTIPLNEVRLKLGGGSFIDIPTSTPGTLAVGETFTMTVAAGTTVSIDQPVTATITPERKIVEGSSTSFSVTGTDGGGTLTYQWQHKLPGSPSFADIAGETATTLNLGPRLTSDDGTQYQCVITDNTHAVTFGPSTLTVWPHLSIDLQPVGGSFYSNSTPPGSVLLQMQAGGGSGVYAYQWYKDLDDDGVLDAGEAVVNSGTRVTGATTPNLAINPLQNADDGKYRCQVTDTGGGTDPALSTSAAEVRVRSILDVTGITRTPSSGRVYTTQQIQFNVTTAGGYTPLVYKWYKNLGGNPTYYDAGIDELLVNGVNAYGSTVTITDGQLVISNLHTSDTGSYGCVVNDDVSKSDDSTTLALEVWAPLTVSPQPVAGKYYTNANVVLTIGANGGEGPYSYQWFKDANNNGTMQSGEQLSNTGVFSGVTTDELTISPIGLTNEGRYGCVVYDDGDGLDPSVTSTTAFIEVRNSVTITTQPAGGPRYVDDWIAFTTGSTGGYLPVAYQWFKDANGNSQLDAGEEIGNGGQFSGATTTNFQINPVGFTDAGSYGCKVTDSYTASATTTPMAVLTVSDPLRFDLQPLSGMYYIGGTINLDVEADGGTEPYTYRWFRDANSNGVIDPGETVNNGPTGNGSFVGGATTPNLQISFAALLDAGNYRCRVTDATTTQVVSEIAVVAVANPVAAVIDPNTYHGNTGGSFTFHVTASNGHPGYTYQWAYSNGGAWSPLVNGTGVSGATSASLTLSSLTLARAGNYRCTVTDSAANSGYSTATTPAVVFTVTDLLSYSGPAFVGGSIIPKGDATSIQASGVGGKQSYTYQWLHNGVAITSGEGGTYGGWTSSTLTIQTGRADLSEAGTYSCTIDDQSPDPSVTTGTVTLQVYAGLYVTLPAGGHANTGDSFTFQVQALSGVSPYSYQWFKDLNDNGALDGGEAINDGDLGGRADVVTQGAAPSSSQLTINNLDVSDAGSYACVATDALTPTPASATSGVAVLTVTPELVVGTASLLTTGDYSGATATFGVTASGGDENFTYQWFYDANDDGLMNPGEALADGPAASGATISGVNTDEMVITNAQQDDSGKYGCVVDDGSPEPAKASGTADLQLRDSVNIQTQPEGGHRNTGQSFTCAVVAVDGYPDLSYQWFIDENDNGIIDGGEALANGPTGTGSQVTGANTDTLTINLLQTTDEGNYRCRVSDTRTSAAVSDPAALTVTILLSVGGPNPSNISVYTAQSPNLSVTAQNGRASYGYTWFKDADGDNMMDAGEELPEGGKFVGTKTPSLSINGANPSNSGYYGCVVSDSSPDPDATSAMAHVRVCDHMYIQTDPASQNVYNDSDPVTFNVGVFGGIPPITYTWQVNTGSGWTTLGAPSQTSYTTPPPSLAYHNYKYRVLVADTGAYNPISGVATLGVYEHIQILTDPVGSDTLKEGKEFTMSVVTSGGIPTVGYQWQKYNTVTGVFEAILGANEATYELNPLRVADTGDYRVVVFDGEGESKQSAIATLVVTPGTPVASILGLSILTVLSGAAGVVASRRKRS